LTRYINKKCYIPAPAPCINCVFSPWFFSPFKQLSLISVWAWVGYGKSKTLENVKQTKKDGDPDKIIVSISHQGEVENIAKEALGEKTQFIQGAGAGM
jgi:hypothetical protein